MESEKSVPLNKLKQSTKRGYFNNFISEKLKGMILLCISQNIDFDNFRKFCKQKIEKIYLMNYNSLLKYKFEEINILINSNHEIKNFLEEINDPQSPYDPEILEKIISKLDIDKMKKIDEQIKSVDFSRINLEAKADKILLENGKNIFVYKEFILITEKIFNVIKNKLSLNSNAKSIYYAYNNGDIFTINEKSNSSIFFGNYNKNSHLFNLRYILNFDKEESLNKELKFLLNYGIEQYKEEKTIFNEENNKDLISPIYDGNYEIGSFYKYRPGINYGNITLGYNIKDINNKKLDLVLKLYNYYENFKRKMKQSDNQDEKYFLIKKDIMDDVKKDINYDFIIQILNKANFNKSGFNNDKKQKLFILKNFPEESYDNYFNSLKPIEKRIKDFISPNEISIVIPYSKNIKLVAEFNSFNILVLFISKHTITLFGTLINISVTLRLLFSVKFFKLIYFNCEQP